jgi:hypothetical protein
MHLRHCSHIKNKNVHFTIATLIQKVHLRNCLHLLFNLEKHKMCSFVIKDWEKNPNN